MRIELTQAHEHAGRNYPAGSVIELPKDSAEWLVAIGNAKAAKPAKQNTGDAQ